MKPGLEKWLSVQKRLLFLQRTWIWFQNLHTGLQMSPVPGHLTHLWPPWAHMWFIDRYAGTYTYTKLMNKTNSEAWNTKDRDTTGYETATWLVRGMKAPRNKGNDRDQRLVSTRLFPARGTHAGHCCLLHILAFNTPLLMQTIITDYNAGKDGF